MRERRDVDPVEPHAARLRRDEPENRLRSRRLATARLTDERDHLAPSHAERDAGDRMHVPVRATKQHTAQPARDAVADDQILDLEQRPAVVRGAAHLHDLERAREVARARVTVAHRSQLGTLRHAACLGPVAARSERTAVELDVESRRHTGDRHHVVVRLEVGSRQPEQPRVGMPRLVVESIGRPLLDDLPGVHHSGVRARLGDDRQVVRDEHEREAELVRQVRQELEDLRLHHHVERSRRLVREQDARVAGERHRDRRALAHSPGELVRIAPRPLGLDPDRLEQLADAGRRLLARGVPVELHRLGDLLADALDRVERVHRALEDHRDVLPAVRRDGLLSALEHVDPLERRSGRKRTPWAGAGPSTRGSSSSCRSPDSPTIPSLVPAATEKDTPRTACSVLPFGRSNQTLRSSTSSSGCVHELRLLQAPRSAAARGSAAPTDVPCADAG